MSNAGTGYGRAIYDAWWNDVRPNAVNKAKSLRAGLIGIAAGLIVTHQAGKMDTAENAAITTAAVLGTTLTVTMIAHLTWSWATAPRRIFYGQQKAISDLRLIIQSAGGPPQIHEVKEWLEDLQMTCPLGDQGREFDDFRNWFSAAMGKIREMLSREKLSEFHRVPQRYIGGDLSGILNRTDCAYNACAKWLEHTRINLCQNDINPNFRVQRAMHGQLGADR